MEYRQRDWPEWLATAELAVNNKVHLAIKISLFMVNYRRELRIGVDIRRKVEKATEFVERTRREAGAALRKAQEEIKQQADKRRREIK